MIAAALQRLPLIIMASKVIAAMTFAMASSVTSVSAFCSKPIRYASANSRQKSTLPSMSHSQDSISNGIKYLGSGPGAIVRPGVVLVAPEHEYDHFLMKSVVFVYAIGVDDNDDLVIRG